jgi:hypothetical protein
MSLFNLKDEGTFESVAEAYTYLRSKTGT